MAFDRPIEADLADDHGEGLLSSILRATVWLLGGDQSQQNEKHNGLEKAVVTSADDDGGESEDDDDDDDDDAAASEWVRMPSFPDGRPRPARLPRPFPPRPEEPSGWGSRPMASVPPPRTRSRMAMATVEWGVTA
mmetsp:Transcript_10825/g.23363  ORF Transcript_10825/g.23363 Transcript_10825/m.23363 type:complete len:135 (-) Transcript_10825:293-697(-)